MNILTTKILVTHFKPDSLPKRMISLARLLQKIGKEQMSSAGEEQTPGIRAEAENRRNGVKDKMCLLYNPLKSKGDKIMPNRKYQQI